MNTPKMDDSSLTQVLRVAEICVTELQPQLTKGTKAYAEYATDMCAFLSALAIISSLEEWADLQETIISTTSSQAIHNAIRLKAQKETLD